jgi:small ligand-binding sensory domain FIST
MDLPDGDAPPQAWRECLGIRDGISPHFILLVDPFTPHVEDLISGLDYVFPETSKIGGLASGGSSQGSNTLILLDQVYRSGIVGVALSGDIAVDTVVAQGCRPIGKTMRITDCNGNVLKKIDGERPLDVLENLAPTLSDHDRELMASSLFLGVGMDPLSGARDLERGDFLIRNLIGADHATGVLVVGEQLQIGQAIQFQLRDSQTSALDLEIVLSSCVDAPGYATPAGVLLFSCLGRGEHLYGVPDYDSSIFREKAGEIPLGGFFAMVKSDQLEIRRMFTDTRVPSACSPRTVVVMLWTSSLSALATLAL